MKSPTHHYLDEALPLLDKAARKTMARIREDREKAPEKLKPLLAYLEGHLFEKGLSVNKLKEACGVRDNSLTLHFHAQVGASPKPYITARRMETAVRLLRDSDLRIWQISEIVGYSGLSVFGKAFARWEGQRPAAFRRMIRRHAALAEEPLEGLVEEELLRCAMAGTLPTRQARALLRRLLAIYPPSG